MAGWYPGGRGYRAPYGANNNSKPVGVLECMDDASCTLDSPFSHPFQSFTFATCLAVMIISGLAKYLRGLDLK